MKHIFSCAAFGLVVAASVTGVAADTKKADQSFGHWVLRCIEVGGGGEACALRQRLHSQATKAPVASFAIADNEKGADHRLTAILPLGLDIPAGVSGELAGRKFSYQVQTCLARGCIANAALTSDDLAALKTEQSFTTSFRLRGVAEPVSVTVSLQGLAEGLKALDAR
ncbi:invasion associated locus B family protein [Aestuariivirga sp.]|jgi:invasion protein IalB|uniref:invasion associated locus B family protein n=1 Tax=Aestuariivirga sp. TaxID=2650926 RepID=UPI00378400E4